MVKAKPLCEKPPTADKHSFSIRQVAPADSAGFLSRVPDRNPLVTARRRTDSCADSLDMNMALARSIEFTEIDALPGSEHRFAVIDNQCFAGTEQAAFDMGRTVPLEVVIIIVQWNQFVDPHDDVTADIRVGVLVYGNRCSGVGRVYDRQSFGNIILQNGHDDIVGNVDQFNLFMTFNRQGSHEAI